MDLCGLMGSIFVETAVAPYLYTKIHAVSIEVVDDGGLHPGRGSSGVTGRQKQRLSVSGALCRWGLFRTPEYGLRIYFRRS